LIYGTNPSDYGAGSGGTPANEYGFRNQGGAGGQFVLTDGQFPGVGGSYNIQAFATLGRSGGAVTYVTYTLPASDSGYNITNIQVYGGWTDNGRDHQEYTISYSTVSAPSTFVELDQVYYQPPTTPNSPTATHVTFESATPGAAMASDVYAVKFDFTTPTQGSDWVGYAEIQIFGTPVATINPNPTNIVAVVTGVPGSQTLTLSWPADHIGWTLQTQTNSLSVGLSNNWVDVPGSDSVDSVSIPIDVTQPSVFYRMIYNP
jgi:hypothetical protein